MWLKRLFDRSTADEVVSTPFKEIAYRGGIVKFSIPADWSEFYDEAGNGVYYKEEPDSGTLRLNVVTFTAPDETKEIEIYALAESRAKLKAGKFMPLDNGNTLVTSQTESVENGINIGLHVWELYNAPDPMNGRIATFSFTLLSRQMKQQKYILQMEMLDEQIRDAKFADEIGSLTA